MASADNIRNEIINKLLTISNKEYLSALYQLVKSSSSDKDQIELTEQQTLMLNLSDDDIKNNRLISQSQIDRDDLKWLRDL